MAGWLKIHRQMLDSPIFQNEKLFKVFMYCLMKASHKEHEQLIGRQVVSLKSGQFVFGRKKASEELNMAPSTVWDHMKMLKKMDTLDMKTNNKFTVVTVVNWAIYQESEGNTDNKPTTNEQQMNNRWTTDEQQMDTNKNVKNYKNVKNDKNDNNNNTDAVGEVFSNYEELGFGILNPYKSEQLTNWINEFNPEMVIKAMQIATNAGKPNMNYLNGILRKWKEKGIDDMQKVEAEQNRRRATSSAEDQPEDDERLDYYKQALANAGWEWE